MGIEFTVRLREPGLERQMHVFAATHADAAEEAMTSWLATGALGVDQMPLQVVTASPHATPQAQRFQFEAPDTYKMEAIPACRVCGCGDEDACDPPCSWVEDDLCSAPACLEAAAQA